MSKRKGFVSNVKKKINVSDPYCSIENCSIHGLYNCFYCDINICLNHRIKVGEIIICIDCSKSKEKQEMLEAIAYRRKTNFLCCFSSKRVSFI